MVVSTPEPHAKGYTSICCLEKQTPGDMILLANDPDFDGGNASVLQDHTGESFLVTPLLASVHSRGLGAPVIPHHEGTCSMEVWIPAP